MTGAWRDRLGPRNFFAGEDVSGNDVRAADGCPGRAIGSMGNSITMPDVPGNIPVIVKPCHLAAFVSAVRNIAAAGAGLPTVTGFDRLAENARWRGIVAAIDPAWVLRGRAGQCMALLVDGPAGV